MTDTLLRDLLKFKTIWMVDDKVFIIDQTLLPVLEKSIGIENAETMADAIKQLKVRGAPAIGVAAAYGAYLAARNAAASGADVRQAALQSCDLLAASRPTAVNLFWALNRVRTVINQSNAEGAALVQAILSEAKTIHDEDAASCEAIGRFGSHFFPANSRVLTHCNAGALATSGCGTALAPLYQSALAEGNALHVYADETRPLLQGARLTAWELTRCDIPVTVLCDGMAAPAMAAGMIDCVIVGSDRIARNGDFANKIGTYSLALAAHAHGLPFYVAAPLSTVDWEAADGTAIPIEQRHASEVRQLAGTVVTPEAAAIFNPAFDVTPAKYVTAFITDAGVVFPADLETLRPATPAK